MVNSVPKKCKQKFDGKAKRPGGGRWSQYHSQRLSSSVLNTMTRQKARDILQISNSATAKEIRSAYLDMVKVWHPDRFVNDPALQARASDKLKLIIEAHTALISSAESDTEEPKAHQSTASQAQPPKKERGSDNSPPDTRSTSAGRNDSHPPIVPATARIGIPASIYFGIFGIGILVLMLVAGAIIDLSSGNPTPEWEEAKQSRPDGTTPQQTVDLEGIGPVTFPEGVTREQAAEIIRRAQEAKRARPDRVIPQSPLIKER